MYSCCIFIFRENETPQQKEVRISKDNERYSSLSTRERRDRNAKSNAIRDIKRQALDENELNDLKKKEAVSKKLTRKQR